MCRHVPGRRAAERAVDAMRVVIIPGFAQLARPVYGVPAEATAVALPSGLFGSMQYQLCRV